MKFFNHRTTGVKTNIILTLLVILALQSILFAQLNSSRGIQTNILSTTPTSTTIEFILNDYDELTVVADGTESIFFSIPGSVWLMEKGMPQLPIHRSSIIIPDLAAMNFNIIFAEYTEIETLKNVIANYDESHEYYHHFNELIEVCDNDMLRPLYTLLEQLDASKHKFGWIGDYDTFLYTQIVPHMKKTLEVIDGTLKAVEENMKQFTEVLLKAKNELINLEKEKDSLSSEKSSLEKEKGQLENDKSKLEAEKAQSEKEKGQLEKETIQLESDKTLLEKEKAELEKVKKEKELVLQRLEEKNAGM